MSRPYEIVHNPPKSRSVWFGRRRLDIEKTRVVARHYVRRGDTKQFEHPEWECKAEWRYGADECRGASPTTPECPSSSHVGWWAVSSREHCSASTAVPTPCRPEMGSFLHPSLRRMVLPSRLGLTTSRVPTDCSTKRKPSTQKKEGLYLMVYGSRGGNPCTMHCIRIFWQLKRRQISHITISKREIQYAQNTQQLSLQPWTYLKC